MMKPQRTIFICINGVNSDPSSARGWTDEFVTSLNIDTPEWIQAEKFEYYTSVFFRFLQQRKRAQELTRKINIYLNAGYRVVLIGHSNGCALIALAFDMGVKVDSIHLFAAAALEKDFEEAIESKLVRRVHLYGSANDKALQAAKFTSKFLKWFGLGYGSLGLQGASLAQKYPNTVKDHSVEGYGHSTWFIPGKHYNYTMSLLLANERMDRAEVLSVSATLEKDAEVSP